MSTNSQTKNLKTCNLKGYSLIFSKTASKIMSKGETFLYVAEEAGK